MMPRKGGALLRPALANRAVHTAIHQSCKRKRIYDTMQDAEVMCPPSQGVYLCAWAPHWHRVTKRP